ncbi:MAG: hypothetical protein HY023_01210 [Chloroflexi bacterium]|nr:hypothetical protein [Chloroflexota bacterium]
MVYSGSQFFTGAWEGLKRRAANMHTLIALGVSVAWLYSTVALLFPQVFPSEMFVDVYYDVTVVVTSLVVLGLAMEIKAKGRTSEAIRKLSSLQALALLVVLGGVSHIWDRRLSVTIAAFLEPVASLRARRDFAGLVQSHRRQAAVARARLAAPAAGGVDHAGWRGLDRSVRPANRHRLPIPCGV